MLCQWVVFKLLPEVTDFHPDGFSAANGLAQSSAIRSCDLNHELNAGCKCVEWIINDVFEPSSMFASDSCADSSNDLETQGQ